MPLSAADFGGLGLPAAAEAAPPPATPQTPTPAERLPADTARIAELVAEVEQLKAHAAETERAHEALRAEVSALRRENEALRAESAESARQRGVSVDSLEGTALPVAVGDVRPRASSSDGPTAAPVTADRRGSDPEGRVSIGSTGDAAAAARRRSVTPPANLSALPDNPFGVKSIPAFGGGGKRRTPSPDNPFGTPAAALAATAAVTRLRAATVAVPGADNPFAAPPSALKGNPFRR